MKINIMYLEQTRITEEDIEKNGGEFSCDWCDSEEEIQFDMFITYYDEWNLGPFNELHYLCAVCISNMMQKYIKHEVIEI